MKRKVALDILTICKLSQRQMEIMMDHLIWVEGLPHTTICRICGEPYPVHFGDCGVLSAYREGRKG